MKRLYATLAALALAGCSEPPTTYNAALRELENLHAESVAADADLREHRAAGGNIVSEWILSSRAKSLDAQLDRHGQLVKQLKGTEQ